MNANEAPQKVKFKKWDCVIKLGKYSNNGLAIQLVNEIGVIAVASVNLPQYLLTKNQVFIKDWSENEGMLKALVDVGIVKDTGKTKPTGRVVANLCEYIGDDL